jgi:TonB family protein
VTRSPATRARRPCGRTHAGGCPQAPAPGGWAALRTARPKWRGALLAGLCALGCGTASHPQVSAPPSTPLPAPPEVARKRTTISRPEFPVRIPGVDSSRTLLSRTEALRRLEPGLAESLNTLPGWPEQLVGTNLKHRATIGICVRTDGTVEEAMTADGTGDVNFDLALVQAVRAWRYRPLYIDRFNNESCPGCRRRRGWRRR